MEKANRLWRKELQLVPKVKKLGAFKVYSKFGYIIINGEKYSNFYGEGDNDVLICRCDFNEFRQAKYLTKREVYSPKSPIIIKKFELPRTLYVSLVDDSCTSIKSEISNVLGFSIWERKLKIFKG